MTLSIGTQLGSHEITGLLGKGGMGEVYRARDLKLKREVAIKVLTDECLRDSERVARFQREAEIVASVTDGSAYQTQIFRRLLSALRSLLHLVLPQVWESQHHLK
jgi:serine/threonine protein kinase